jgi:hypothetical protein
VSESRVPGKQARAGEVDLFDLDEAPPPALPAERDEVDEALGEVARAARDVERELPPPGDLELDEDIFDFGPMPGAGIDPLTEAAHEIEGVLAGLDKPGAQLAPELVSAVQQSFALAHSASGQAALEQSLARGSFAAPSRPVLIAAALLALLNLALLVGALRVGSALRSDLEGVRGDIAATASALHESLREPAQAAAAEPAAEVAPATPDEAVRLGPGELALAVAHEELDAGLYAAARRRLSRLLVTIDERPAELRDSLEARASYLLAESWAREADARRGLKP